MCPLRPNLVCSSTGLNQRMSSGEKNIHLGKSERPEMRLAVGGLPRGSEWGSRGSKWGSLWESCRGARNVGMSLAPRLHSICARVAQKSIEATFWQRHHGSLSRCHQPDRRSPRCDDELRREHARGGNHENKASGDYHP